MTPFRDPSTPLSIEQSELRKRTLKEIESDPRGFDMNSWEIHRHPNQHYCGTTRCIAGWAQFLARGAVYEYGDKALGIPHVDDDAIGLLGLTAVEFGGTDPADDDGLFYVPNTR